MKTRKSSLTLISCLLAILCSAPASTDGKKLKILGAFSHPGKSHFDVFKPLLEELANRGHDVTVVSYFPRSNTSSPLPNYRDINLAGPQGIYLEIVNLKMIKHTILSPFLEFFLLRHWALESCQQSLANADVQKLIKSNAKFDLVITEIFNSDCFLGFVHKYKAPSIGLSSHVLMPWANSRLSNEHNPSYVPTLFFGFEPNMGFIERVINYIYPKMLNVLFEVMCNWPMQKMVEASFGSDLPALGDIAKNMSAILVNSHYSLHGAKPHLPSIVEVGGLHIAEKRQSLPKDIQKFLDEAKDGVVFFSWGSMIKTTSMAQDKLEEIVKALGSIPWKVIWKWEDEELPGKPDNVMIKKWLPQADILAHPNVKCYVAHGGLLGVSEGVSAGVPMVVVPMYGDQFNNAAAVKSRGAAQVLEWNVLKAETLRSAIVKVVTDSTYQENAKALQQAWHDRLSSALETSVWWAEYVARGHGNHYLKTAAANLHWYQLEHWDVYAFLLLILITVILVLYKLMTVIIRKLFTSFRNNSNHNGVSSSKKRN